MDTILKETPPRTIPAIFGLIWFTGFKGEDLNVNVYDVRRTDGRMTTDDGRRTPSDGQSSHALWQGELKTLSKRKFYALTLYMGAAINRLVSYVKNTGSVQEHVLVTAYNLKSNVLL